MGHNPHAWSTGEVIAATTLNTLEQDLANAAAIADIGVAGTATNTALRTAFGAGREAGHRLVALGDSITIAGDNPEGTGPYVQANDSIWQTASVLSGGALQFVRNAGKGGDTAAGMLARFDTDVTPYAPTMVGLMAGTNDFTFGVTDTQYRTTMRALVAKIRGIGAVPVLLTSPPVNSFADIDRAKVIRNGRWLTRYAAAQSIVCVDVFALMVDPATSGAYRAGYDQGDGIHPSAASRVLIGTAVWTALSTLLPPVGGIVGSCDLDPTNLVRHGMFQAGSAGGFPTSFFAADTPTSGTGSNSIITDTAMPGGLAARLTMTGMTGSYGIREDITTGFAPGDRLLMSCAVHQPVTGASARLAMTYDVDALHWTQTSTTGRLVLQMETVVPAGASALFVNLTAIGSGSTGNIDFGGVAVRNLTTEALLTP